ncbi:MAG: aminotransferase class I/II-fold pyridoxal phosphate-dependent enzyme [Bosea sp.]|uniref:trans-sulfuration enzyme family protein n=1 Tax=unclassified Bosea (in: a-proteobacteria) TaxID=2653178 RepID=UPI00096A1A3A|nr:MULTISPECIES: aminotransferase class I/II-fold pyridoxal phosphate-dependent enzyme [unclassified Bosea (in: a-proteobacteria)]MBN9459328.1 aminotransferase class I/II-fold pyridoxal phosphate-dependent enzyme [Bosea sp. (in: a-proteobacteria)]OJV05477.1 MAG: cystathionine beta-lyase [Bosea sp. 67-29]
MHDLTLCVHHPAVSHDGFASLAVPTYRASTIVYDDAESFARRKQRGPDGYSYGLQGTPTTRTLEAQITALHGGVRTVLAPSGQGAVALVMLAVLVPGDHVLIPDTVYPPVRDFCINYLAPRGITFTAYDPLLGEKIGSVIDDRTRLIWVESPGSGTMEVQDLPAISRVAKARGVLVGCDNTWASPLLFKPLAHGADFVVEALTKYVGGHSDLLLGSVTVADLGLRQKLKDTLRLLGIGVSPDEVSLALRGIETMGLRMAHTGRVAEEFARRLSNQPSVERVLHPALPGCPGHDVFKRDFKGGSAVFSIVLKPGAERHLDAGLSALNVFALGASWGGTRSLVAPMAIKEGRTATVWASEGTVLRISIGLEDPDELWSDLEKLLGALELPNAKVA